ncbi:hypothetical protein ACFQQB_05585 [Nonomuraea rubra]
MNISGSYAVVASWRSLAARPWAAARRDASQEGAMPANQSKAWGAAPPGV